MKKTLIAALASLMLAGAIAGVSEATVRISQPLPVLGEGSLPAPVQAPFTSGDDSSMSHNQ